MTKRETTAEFLKAFCGRDMQRLTQLVADDLVLEGPLFRFESRADYFESLHADSAGDNTDFEILRTLEHGDDLCVLYRLIKPEGALLVSQWNRFRGEEIAEIILCFDASGFQGPP